VKGLCKHFAQIKNKNKTNKRKRKEKANATPPNNMEPRAHVPPNLTSPETFAQCGTLLCLDVPEGVQFGLDGHLWTVGPRFKGIKLIPPGSHFICHAMGDKHGSAFTPRVGFWLYFSPGEVREHSFL
jgi:hypothetical protein